ncbi:MAG: hypothetical protein IIZ73_01810 [Ruminococcus sp.]|nr:hypothetical protein [Ruminococcus sp.]
MALDVKDIAKKAEGLVDKIPDEVKEKAKDLATKENLEKVKDEAEKIIDKVKKDKK